MLSVVDWFVDLADDVVGVAEASPSTLLNGFAEVRKTKGKRVNLLLKQPTGDENFNSA